MATGCKHYLEPWKKLVAETNAGFTTLSSTTSTPKANHDPTRPRTAGTAVITGNAHLCPAPLYIRSWRLTNEEQSPREA